MNSSIILTAAQTADWLDKRDRFLLLTHRRPDGDTLGCAAALAQALQEYGKTAYVLYNPEVTPRYSRFVDSFWSPDGYAPEYVITVDTASTELFPEEYEQYKDAVSLCIDHHPSNTLYAEFTYLDASCASCGEIIYDILIRLKGNVSTKSAEGLYVALTSDTGCFVFANTTANTLRVASLLIDAGAPYREINKLLFRMKAHSRIKIEGMIYSGIEFHYDGAVAISTITRGMIEEAGATEDDLDDISSLPGSIDSVLAGITIRELTGERDCKVSVRSSPAVSSNEICARFGGGGHPMAGGFSLKASIPEIKKMLLEVLPEYLPKALKP